LSEVASPNQTTSEKLLYSNLKIKLGSSTIRESKSSGPPRNEKGFLVSNIDFNGVSTGLY